MSVDRLQSIKVIGTQRGDLAWMIAEIERLNGEVKNLERLPDDSSTHWDGCWKVHHLCAIKRCSLLKKCYDQSTDMVTHVTTIYTKKDIEIDRLEKLLHGMSQIVDDSLEECDTLSAQVKRLKNALCAIVYPKDIAK